jgi:hypothetical protein
MYTPLVVKLNLNIVTTKQLPDWVSFSDEVSKKINLFIRLLLNWTHCPLSTTFSGVLLIYPLEVKGF